MPDGGACGKTRVLPHSRRHDEGAHGRDRWRRSDGADAGGRAGACARRGRHRRAGGPTRTSSASRAGGLAGHAPSRCSISAWSRERFLSQRAGHAGRGASADDRSLDISDFPDAPRLRGSRCFRTGFERILAAWVDELGVPVHREREVTGLAQDETGVDVQLSDGGSLRGEVPRGVRRWAEPRPQDGRHRLPRVGRVHQLSDCRGCDDQRARVGHPP